MRAEIAAMAAEGIAGYMARAKARTSSGLPQAATVPPTADDDRDW